MSSVKKYDDNGNLIYHKDSDGFECWYKYNEDNDVIFYKNSAGYEWDIKKQPACSELKEEIRY